MFTALTLAVAFGMDTDWKGYGIVHSRDMVDCVLALAFECGLFGIIPQARRWVAAHCELWMVRVCFQVAIAKDKLMTMMLVSQSNRGGISTCLADYCCDCGVPFMVFWV